MNLHERILAEIDGSSSQNPAIASVVRSALGDVGAAAFGDALDALERTRRICTCEITRGKATWQVIWPTGVIVESGAWTSKSMSGITAPSVPRRLPQSPHERNKEPIMATTQPTIDQRVDALRKVISAAPAGAAISVIEVGKSIGFDSKTARVMMAPAVKRLLNAGDVTEVTRPDGMGRASQYLVAATTNTEQPTEREERKEHQASCGKAAEPDLTLCIYDDGRMLIDSKQMAVELTPAETRKLVRFVVAMEGIATGGTAQ